MGEKRSAVIISHLKISLCLSSRNQSKIQEAIVLLSMRDDGVQTRVIAVEVARSSQMFN